MSDHHSDHHIVPQKTYLAIFACLIGLTLLTTGVAFIDMGPFNTPVALLIAFTKMLLVIFFFMHLRQSSGLIRIVLLAGFFWLALLIALTSSDYRTRSWTPVPQPWSASAPPTHP
jgi:cytochrome c oxidase subunit 4